MVPIHHVNFFVCKCSNIFNPLNVRLVFVFLRIIKGKYKFDSEEKLSKNTMWLWDREENGSIHVMDKN